MCWLRFVRYNIAHITLHKVLYINYVQHIGFEQAKRTTFIFISFNLPLGNGSDNETETEISYDFTEMQVVKYIGRKAISTALNL